MQLKKFILLLGILLPLLQSCSDKKIIPKNIMECENNGSWCISKNSQNNTAILLPELIPYLKPFPVQIKILKKTKTIIELAQIKFSMQGMAMGVNSFNLILQKENNHEQIWKTESILPICVTGRKDWIINLSYKLNNVIYNDYFVITI